MSREEEIQKAAYNNDRESSTENMAYFREGAIWADENPRKGLVYIEKVCAFLHGVRLDYYAEHNDELINDLRKALEE